MPLFLDSLLRSFSLDSGDSHGFFIGQTFILAAEAAGLTAPNPAVGALVVAYSPTGEPVIVGRGKTQSGGRPHAEDMALAHAGERARGATLYVTLEPCCHEGQGPSCVSRILESGIARVICGLKDPDPRMCGAGFAALEKAGVEVIYDPRMEVWGRKAHRSHILRITCGRPEVTLKLAQTADGYAGVHGERLFISEDHAQRFMHRLRAHSDAIMVGIGTVMADDPQLTVRDPDYISRRPTRIVLDSGLHMPIDSRLVRTAREYPTWVITAYSAPHDREVRLLDLGVRIFKVATEREGKRLNIEKVLNKLGEEGITSVLSEGGMKVAHTLIAHDQVDYFVSVVNHRTAQMCAKKRDLEFFKPSNLIQKLISEHKGPLRAFSQDVTLDMGNDTAFIFEG